MKTLTELKNTMLYSMPDVLGYRTFEEFMYINNLSENDITSDAIYEFELYNYNRILERPYSQANYFINETLMSHDTDIIKRVLIEEFDDNIKNITIYKSKAKPNSLYVTFNDEEPIKSYVFKRICDFFNYIISDIKHYEDTDDYDVYLEPNITNEVTDYVYDDCDGVVYHVTYKSNVESILRTGLRPTGCTSKEEQDAIKKMRSPTYRFFSKRNYMFCIDNKDKLMEEVKKICTAKNMSLKDCTLLKIDLNKISKRYIDNKISFYQDASNSNKSHIYTLTYIPGKYIEVVNI